MKKNKYRKAFDEMLLPEPRKEILDWFNKPLKKVGKLYGVTFITIRPFPKINL